MITKDLGMERLSWLISVDPKCSHKSPNEKEADGDLARRDWRAVVTSQGLLAGTRSWGRQGADYP